MACRDAMKRAMPGRIVGVSIDSHGNRAYRLSLQTREQHIRREKATSNVCTAQALLAVMASMYAVFHGPEGLKAIAQRIHRKTVRLARGLEAAGFKVEPKAFFDTITVDVGLLQRGVLQSAVREGVNLRRVGETKIGITLDERTRTSTVEAVWRAFGIVMEDSDFAPEYRLPEALLRESAYLTHPIFHMNRAETEMMRYMRRLADRDLALDRAMIPLGSCTMKLNSAAEMMPVSWREFSLLHPFAPADQAIGYKGMIDDLSAKLCDITGYAAISMQPNSGAQGEYAGLLTIAAYHRVNGEGHRKVCLIPVSAHGTNPASAQMVGWDVVVVKSAANGDIDVEDFRAKAEKHSGTLAACMITYPSTHGVFEETVREICEITHSHGGPRRPRWRCEPSQPAQDLLHPAWRRRTGHGADWRQGTSGAVSSRPSRDRRAGGAGQRRALWLALALAYFLGLLPDDGRRGSDAGHEGGDPQRQLHRETAGGGL
jgi:glycine dehydrogenase